MFHTRLAALFARYCSVHLTVAARPLALFDVDGQTFGQLDRIYLHGQRLFVEGWANSNQITLAHAGQRVSVTPDLARHDVVSAYPNLKTQTPGFRIDLPRGEGGVTFSVMRGAERLVYIVPQPSGRAWRAAQLRQIWPFLRGVTLGLPAILSWFATKDPNCRTRLKRALKLDTAAPTRQMQPLLFLTDCLPTMPATQHRAELARLQPIALAQRGITIVVPIFNAMDLLPEALNRIALHTDVPWRLILIDDASTDPAVRPFLHAWVSGQSARQRARISVKENSVNQGFIRSVNLGLKQAIDHGDHVVLLNSDAFVPQAWASRLIRPFLEHDRVASVTPMSNNAEIFCAPIICKPVILRPGDGDAIDKIAREIHPDAGLADAPTGVGFCMAMSIDYLRKLPQLDTTFGRGYGEEVDWCQKVRALGGRHLGLANLFVEHRGSTSFGTAERQRLIARNNAVISQRYPAYDAEVQRFIRDDPLVASRLALAIGWAARQAGAAIPLFLAHDLGGGAEDYLARRIADTYPESALVLRVGTQFRWQLELHSPHGITSGGTDDFALIERMLAPCARLRIIYSCGVGDTDPIILPERLLSLKRGPQDQIEVLVHDYLLISPSYTLLDATGRYRGVPDRTTSDSAHCGRRPNGAPFTLADWQAAWGRLVDHADDIVVFSQSSKDILAAAYPLAQRKLRVIPHKLLVAMPPARQPVRMTGPVIGVLGNIGFHKGAAVLQDLSQRLGTISGAKLIVLGRMDPNFPLPATNTRIHGGYLREEIPLLAARYGITDWLIPSIWPETFSYTTHEAVATGLPVWGFDLGAQADAIRCTRFGGVVPIPGGTPDLAALFATICHSKPDTESAAA